MGTSAFRLYLSFHVVLHLLSWMKQRQVSYLHRTVLAKPISEEDVDWNVTNPSVLVWICMLIWSNGPSGDRAMEQFNHAISDGPTRDGFLRDVRELAVDILALQGEEDYPACLK